MAAKWCARPGSPSPAQQSQLDLCRQCRAEHGEELLETFDSALLPDPQQAHAARLDLINQSQITMPSTVLDLVNADGADGSQLPMFQAPLHHILDRLTDLFPTGVKAPGRLGPRKLTRPVREKQQVGLRQGVLTPGPRHLFNLDPAGSALNSPHSVQ